MTIVRVKGVKRYRSKGRWYYYHRLTGTRLKAEFGTGEFFAELAALERRVKREKALPGTLGMLLASYRASPAFVDLAASTCRGYLKMMDIIRPLEEMPLAELTSPFIAGLRDKLATQRGRRTANFVMAVVSVACEHGKEQGLIAQNPVKGVKRVRRPRGQPKANRPWMRDECRTALDNLPAQLILPVALAMFTGLRQGDVLSLKKNAVREGHIWRVTGKTGQEVSLPVHPRLGAIIASAAPHDAITLTASSNGTPWTSDGFRASFNKAMRRLEGDGKVGTGLTFHGLRHTVGTMLIEAGVELDIVRRWLGQKTLAMAIHYSEGANTAEQMSGAVLKFDPLGSKQGTSNV
jgi:integrase